MPDPTECSSCAQLRQRIDQLTGDLETYREELVQSDSRMLRFKKLFEGGSKFADELRAEIVNLNQDLDTWKTKVKVTVRLMDACVQTDPEIVTCTGNHGNGRDPCNAAVMLAVSPHGNDVSDVADDGQVTDVNMENPEATQYAQVVADDRQQHSPEDSTVPAWVQPADETEEGEIEPEEPLSVAESLREAAEAAQQQTGFTYDESTGLYFDKSSGYYYDAEKSLYYEPYTGTYYYFDTETNSYTFHSQADFSSYSSEAYAQYCLDLTRQGKKQKKKRKKSEVEDQVIEKATKRKRKDKRVNDDETKRRKRQDKDALDKTKHSALIEGSQDELIVKNTKHKNRHRQKHKDKISKVNKQKHKHKHKDIMGEQSDEIIRKYEKKHKKSSRRKTNENKSSGDNLSEDYDNHKKRHHKKHRKKHRKHSEKSVQSREASDSQGSKEELCEVVDNTMNSEDHNDKCISNSITESQTAVQVSGHVVADKFNSKSEDGSINSVSNIFSNSEELQTSDSESDSESSSLESSTSSEDIAAAVSALHYPPCVRLIVTESKHLDRGSLFIIPYTGGTVGQAENLGHTIVIADVLISKMHCSFQYNDADKQYEVKDHASRNGTFINKHRLSATHEMSEAYVVRNLDVLQLGGSTFQLHIHPGNQTCEDCEPGLIQAKLDHKQNGSEAVETIDSKLDKEKKRRREIKQIRIKYGLERAPYEDHSSLRNPTYQDRASERRVTKGSDNPYQRDDAPASVHRAISTENKGHKLLSKMGWKEGESLGRSEQGIKHPIQAEIRSNQAAGLGSSLAYRHSLDNVATVKVTERWTKAQHRYRMLEKQQGQGQRKGERQAQGQKSNELKFVQGQTETFDIEKTELKNASRTTEAPVTITDTKPNVTMEMGDSSQEKPKVTMTVNWSKGQSSKIPGSDVTKNKGLDSVFGIESDSDENG